MSKADQELRIEALEREVRRWRWGVLVVGAAVAFASCEEPPAPPTHLELASEDGAVRVRLDEQGLRLEREEASAVFGINGVYVTGERGATTMEGGSLLLRGAAEQMTTVTPTSVVITTETGRVQLEGGELARVAVVSPGARVEIGAIGEEATLRVEGGDGSVRVGGVASPSASGLSLTDASGTRRYRTE